MDASTIQGTKRHRAVVESFAGFCSAIPSVRRVIVFGSRARGDADDRSDIDIAIDAPRLSRKDWIKIVHAAEDANTLLQLQVVDLRDAEGAFRESIETEGIVLYERKEKR